jgi:hypothetical protein
MIETLFPSLYKWKPIIFLSLPLLPMNRPQQQQTRIPNIFIFPHMIGYSKAIIRSLSIPVGIIRRVLLTQTVVAAKVIHPR